MNSFFHASILTPTFLYGNDKNRAELRIPSVKGVMRYWWRAAFCEEDINLLSEKECKLFGSQSNKSPFSLRIAESKIKQGRYDMLPYPRPNKKWDSHFNALMPETNFKVIVETKDEYIHKMAMCSLELSFLLGGLGKRSRRGFGSVRIIESYHGSYNKIYSSKQDFLTNLLGRLNEIKPDGYKIEETGITNISFSKGNFKYPVIKNIQIGTPESSYSELLKRIDKATHDNADKSLGDGRKRMASPAVVRIQKISDKYYPVIIELHSIYPYQISSEKPKEKFIRQVLQGEA